MPTSKGTTLCCKYCKAELVQEGEPDGFLRCPTAGCGKAKVTPGPMASAPTHYVGVLIKGEDA